MGKKLKDQLFQYLQENHGPIASGNLQRIYFPKYAYGTQKGYHTPRSVVRRLEELTNEGKIQVEYRKNHAHYSIKEEHRKLKQIVTELPSGQVKIEYQPV